jgi:hypothetical protein
MDADQNTPEPYDDEEKLELMTIWELSLDEVLKFYIIVFVEA